MNSPIAQAQISGFFTTVMAIARADCFSGEAKCASTATLNTLTIGMIATMATEASASPAAPKRLRETESAT